MRILLATGIYPPQIGGPATYVARLAAELTAAGIQVTVLTYADAASESDEEGWRVVAVTRAGNVASRWLRYARALRRESAGADIVHCFSSVSCGVPLYLARLRGPKKMLRLGGDFRWERYTDRGGEKGLREWYATPSLFHGSMNGLLQTFDHLVFSTRFQQELYEKSFTRLPLHSVIENALPSGKPMAHEPHEPFRLLFLGRFVAFKNLVSLLLAVRDMPDVRLTLVGDGPLSGPLHALAAEFPKSAQDRIVFHAPLAGIGKQHAFADHDLLVLPSLTDISPNTALEARASGLPVLLTMETGLSAVLAEGAVLRELRTPQQIQRAIAEVRETYPQIAARAASPLPERSWTAVRDEHLKLFRALL